VISPSQSPIPDNTQHSQLTDINGRDWMRAGNSSKRAAADPLLITHGHRDWPVIRKVGQKYQ